LSHGIIGDHAAETALFVQSLNDLIAPGLQLRIVVLLLALTFHGLGGKRAMVIEEKSLDNREARFLG
jgi:hypothetical protein